MWEFEYIQGTSATSSRLKITANRLVTNFRKRKKLRKFKLKELSALERFKLNEVTIRETSAEEVERRLERLKREAARI